MKSIKNYVCEAYKPSPDANHVDAVFNMLVAEYNNRNMKVLKALAENNITWFDNMCKDYATYILGFFGKDKQSENIVKQAQEACTKFRSAVKTGLI